MTTTTHRAFGLGLVLFATTLASATAVTAATPKTASVEGFLTSTGGGAAADGTYDMTFSVWANASTATALWTEGPVKVTVSKGQFTWELGSKTALDISKIAATATPLLGIKIGTDPELPRQTLHSVLFALHAGSADSLSCTGCISATQIAGGGISAAKVGFNYAGSTTKGGPAVDLACTGCVSVKELKFDGDVDLAGNSLKAKNGTFSGDVAAATITAGAFIGDGSKLTGIKTPSGECKTAGEVVKGINTDGSLKCVKAMDPAALPKDGLNEISNDLLSNQFIDTISTKDTKVAIPDFQGKEAISNITFPNIGTAQTFSVSVHVENTDLSLLSMVVLPPNDKKVGWKLCDPCGAKDSKIYKASFTPTAKPKSGDIGYWIGKNPQGLWNLKVLDNGFCIPQAAGNAKYCNTTNKTDGWIETWSITIQTLSNQKVAMNGNLIVSGGLTLSGGGKITGDVTQSGNSTFEKAVTFKGPLGYEWCYAGRDGERSIVVGGVCTPGVGSHRTWLSAQDFCRAKGADLCSGAQSLVLRAHGMLPTYTSSGNWTNSFADNDGNNWRDANGATGDDHGYNSGYAAPCCFNNTPSRPTDEIVKWQSGDKGMRVVHIHNKTDVSFHSAAVYCATLNADLCTKSQYVYLRTAGKITVQPVWPNDGEDTDGVQEYGTSGNKSNLADDMSYHNSYGFACCAGERTSSKCPAGSTDTGGVCWVKVHNTNNVNWINAARDCGKLGASICTVSQSSVLRRSNILKSPGNWTAGFSDCDGQCSSSYGIGNAGNNLNQNSGYGYACCL